MHYISCYVKAYLPKWRLKRRHQQVQGHIPSATVQSLEFRADWGRLATFYLNLSVHSDPPSTTTSGRYRAFEPRDSTAVIPECGEYFFLSCMCTDTSPWLVQPLEYRQFPFMLSAEFMEAIPWGPRMHGDQTILNGHINYAVQEGDSHCTPKYLRALILSISGHRYHPFIHKPWQRTYVYLSVPPFT